MSQRSEKLHRQVAQLRSDVDALQVAWLTQQHRDAMELGAAAERTRQAHRRASEAQRTARAWKLNAILIVILTVGAEMLDNRQLTAQYTGQNPMVMQILDMHSTNLLPSVEENG